jgi:hypothetical protein
VECELERVAAALWAQVAERLLLAGALLQQAGADELADGVAGERRKLEGVQHEAAAREDQEGFQHGGAVEGGGNLGNGLPERCHLRTYHVKFISSYLVSLARGVAGRGAGVTRRPIWSDACLYA